MRIAALEDEHQVVIGAQPQAYPLQARQRFQLKLRPELVDGHLRQGALAGGKGGGGGERGVPRGGEGVSTASSSARAWPRFSSTRRTRTVSPGRAQGTNTAKPGR